MSHRRYGTFRFRDYWSAWVFIVSLLLWEGAVLLAGGTEYMYLIPFQLFILYMLYTVVEPNLERFPISKDSIVAKGARKTRTISLPDELTLVFSRADICDSLKKNTGGLHRTYDLKNRYAVSILQKTSIESVLSRLHANHARTYTNTSIEEAFIHSFYTDQYIYSFVYEKNLFDALVDGRKCQLIIPKSLSQRIPIDQSAFDVYIDIAC